MRKFLIRLLFFSSITGYTFQLEQSKAVVPHYYQPSKEKLKQEGLSIGRSAYQLLYFGQIKDSLNLAKLAVKIDKSNETLWTILAEAQIANKLYEDALISLNFAQKINPKMSEIYFAKSSIFIKQSQIKKAKNALQTGIKIEPKNFSAIFQLGNIYLMDKNFEKAIDQFDKAIQIKKDFWQAFNNKGLAYFEIGKVNLSIISLRKAINIKENAEPLLALASCLQNQNIKEAISLAKKALINDPNYVEYNFRKEQLWGVKLQTATQKLFQNIQLEEEIRLARLKISENS